MIPEFVKTNCQVLLMAVEAGRVALMECTDKVTGKPVAVLCAVDIVEPAVIVPGAEPEYNFIPLARMFMGEPDDEVNKPKENDDAS